MKAIFRYFLVLICSSLLGSAAPLELHTRSRVEPDKGSGHWQVQERAVQWDPKKTALVICDMWDKHWCQGATERVAEMAPRMNEVVKAARAQGVFIIHAPSDTMAFYEGTPQRRRAQEAPAATPPQPLKRWCSLDPTKEAPLPIDDSDGGCDDDPQCKNYKAWKQQIPTIEIAAEDAITDSAEAYNLLEQRGIENVIVMGVHANMCVLGRPFSIRQMVGVGKNVLLMRDMTDTMYNSRRRPFVNHFRGTDLIVEHVEKYWCPSITSADFLGGPAFQFSGAARETVQSVPYAAPGPDQAGPLSPQDSLSAFKVFEDLEIEEVLAEPDVRQPLHLSWDERGRLWVVQYLQYPAPAGLTLISKDQFWRAVYDRVPPAPPHHFKGADKITIHEDTDGDGKLDRHKTFVEGLNIVTSIEHGRGGVWVLNPPYLLFFPDKDGDDVVDADPTVHLAGFGLEDTHSVANSLRWGPDGWLYGAHGSTVTANIQRPGLDSKPIARMMGQHIWRYHPETRRFEIFAEGGGNAFGVEMDDKARIFSGHNGGNTRGFHYVQGGYLQKGFEKHGPLANPYAFGYFKQMAHNQAERFTHTFVIYGGGSLPAAYDGQLLGIEPLQGRVVLSDLQRDRSSFKTQDTGYAVTTSDKYFKPVDIKTGPDGAIYIADWYDRQVTHTQNYEGNIDKSNGRVYRLKSKSSTPAQFDPDAFTENLRHPNRWVRQANLRLIADRKDPSLAERFRELCLSHNGQPALEALWAWNLSGGLDDAAALELLSHSDPHVRLWTIRLLGDANQLTGATAERMISMAATEPHVEVRSQLASTARRLPAIQSLPLVRNLLTRSEDADDIHIPLLLWWAIEAKAESDREAVLDLFQEAKMWDLPLVRNTIVERLIKRWAMAGTQGDLRACAKFLRAAPGAQKKKLLGDFEDAFKGRRLIRPPLELQQAIVEAGGESLSFAIRRGDSTAASEAIALLRDQSAPAPVRAELIQIFGEVKNEAALAALLEVVRREKTESLQKSAVAALPLYDASEVAETLIDLLPAFENETRLTALNVLLTRSAWAKALVRAVESGKVGPGSVPPELVDQMRGDVSLAPSVAAIWGDKKDLTTAAIDQKLAQYRALAQSGSGNPFEGQKHYEMACSSCHKLFGNGGEIGPDLTSFKRDELDSMLMSIVNPSGEIREGYENVVVETRDGRSLSGFLAENHPEWVTLRGLDGVSTVITRQEIATLKSSGGSLMPEGLLEGFDEQQLRDLFAYLRATQPLVKPR